MPLQLDLKGCSTHRVGKHGIDPKTLDAAAARLDAITRRLDTTAGTGLERWRRLPVDPMRSEHLAAVNSLVGQLRTKTDELIVLGIGGSALGNTALHAALNPATWNLMPRDVRGGPRLFVLDNVDPRMVHDVLREVERADPGFSRTLVNVISKSGETAETAAQFLLLRSRLARTLGDDHVRHIVATTDPIRGTMRSICEREGYETLPVPEGVGGRFSVLSPVGLFPAAMCGIDIEALLDGAAAMDERCRAAHAAENPAARLAWTLLELTRMGKPIHVLMPYCSGLGGLADWFRQLWAESLGKRTDLDGREIFAGPTPIKALGTTDQHSQVQLYRDGPNDKVIGFVEVTEPTVDLGLPDDLDVEPLRYLHGESLSRLLAAEKRATEYALAESQRPHFTITLPSVDAFHVGAFIQFWMVTTSYAGALLNINTYDQPAVETGKLATFGLMGRDGYDSYQEAVQRKLGEE